MPVPSPSSAEATPWRRLTRPVSQSASTMSRPAAAHPWNTSKGEHCPASPLSLTHERSASPRWYHGSAQWKCANQGRPFGAWSKTQPMQTALNIVMIIGSVLLIALILMQTKGSSFTGAFGGDAGSINRTRRGVEKTLFQFTIGTAAVYVVLAIASSFLI